MIGSIAKPYQMVARNDINSTYSGLADNLRNKFLAMVGAKAGSTVWPSPRVSRRGWRSQQVRLRHSHECVGRARGRCGVRVWPVGPGFWN